MAATDSSHSAIHIMPALSRWHLETSLWVFDKRVFDKNKTNLKIQSTEIVQVYRIYQINCVKEVDLEHYKGFNQNLFL